MHGGPLDHKVCSNRLGAVDFRAHACIRRRQCTITQTGPIFAHLCIKSLATGGVNQQVIG